MVPLLRFSFNKESRLARSGFGSAAATVVTVLGAAVVLGGKCAAIDDFDADGGIVAAAVAAAAGGATLDFTDAADVTEATLPARWRGGVVAATTGLAAAV